MDFGARRVASLAGIILLFLCLVGTGGADESGVRVDYTPPQLSLEARAVSLGAVLRAIGAKVGFSVVESAPSPMVVTLSVQNASLDDVLRQLLRAKNHTIIYRAGGVPFAESGPIDRIVLFGDSTPVTAAATQPGGSSRVPRQAQDHDDAGAKTVPLVPPMPQSWPESTGFLNPASVYTGDPATPPISVGEILQAHAMAALQSGQLAGSGASIAAMSPLASPTPPANLDAALAETTRRAQQSLGALIDGLATATRSLQQSLPAGGK